MPAKLICLKRKTFRSGQPCVRWMAWGLLLATGLAGSLAAQETTACQSSSFGEDFRMGAKLLGQSQAKAAVPYLEKAHQECPSDYADGRDLVLAYAGAGFGDKARAALDQMLQQYDKAELHSISGELYAETGNQRAAAEQYQMAAKLDPSEDNIFDFGTALEKFEGDSAVRIFRFGVQKYPNSEKMHLGLGSALYGQGLVDEAASEVYRASEISPRDPNPMEVLGQMEHIPAGMSQEILGKFSQLHAMYPRNGQLAYDYAMALSGKWSDQPAQETARVVDLLKTAIELDPTLAEAQFQLAEFYEAQGKTAEALHSYEQATKTAPEQESYHYRLALAYKKCGRAEEARREMQIYRQLHAQAP
jgi:tetratricopeptide (TPR) repeat protein